MSEKPKKRRLQIHLSTAIVLMFVAGFLWWANIRGTSGTFVVRGPDGGNINIKAEYLFGWPMHKESEDYPGGDVKDVFGDWLLPPCIFYLYDALFALMLLFCVWYVCEWRIHRGEARK